MSEYRKKQADFLRRGAAGLQENGTYYFAVTDAIEAYLAGATALDRITPLEDHLKDEIRHLADARHALVEHEKRIRDLEAELAVRDDMGNEVLRILREATGRRDFHSEMEAAEWAARMLVEARRDGARLDFALKFMNNQRLFAWFLECNKCKLQTTRGEADIDEWRKWIDAAMEAK